jgi:UDP-N-acetylglucosamine transferase subunit ALG13
MVIFVTVGTQLPFDRLITAVDSWAAQSGRDQIFAQIGPSQMRPSHIEWTQFLSPNEFQQRVEACELLVAHAGMGSIITAMQLRRPILIMPRMASLGEHRNDHQLSTARRLSHCGVHVASDAEHLIRMLAQSKMLAPPQDAPGDSPAELVNAIQQFIDQQCG